MVQSVEQWVLFPMGTDFFAILGRTHSMSSIESKAGRRVKLTGTELGDWSCTCTHLYDLTLCRLTPLTSSRCILNIYSTNIRTEYFKHAA
jgi:hypothetical protein